MNRVCYFWDRVIFLTSDLWNILMNHEDDESSGIDLDLMDFLFFDEFAHTHEDAELIF